MSKQLTEIQVLDILKNAEGMIEANVKLIRDLDAGGYIMISAIANDSDETDIEGQEYVFKVEEYSDENVILRSYYASYNNIEDRLDFENYWEILE